jgi:hypothetical protein
VLEFPGKDCALLMMRAGVRDPAPAASARPPVRAVGVALDGAAATEHLEYRQVAVGESTSPGPS